MRSQVLSHPWNLDLNAAADDNNGAGMYMRGHWGGQWERGGVERIEVHYIHAHENIMEE